MIIPGLAILLTVVALNLIGDALRDALDPRIK
jgi:peptide/nickel transport system permease protein